MIPHITTWAEEESAAFDFVYRTYDDSDKPILMLAQFGGSETDCALLPMDDHEDGYDLVTSEEVDADQIAEAPVSWSAEEKELTLRNYQADLSGLTYNEEGDRADEVLYANMDVTLRIEGDCSIAYDGSIIGVDRHSLSILGNPTTDKLTLSSSGTASDESDEWAILPVNLWGSETAEFTNQVALTLIAKDKMDSYGADLNMDDWDTCKDRIHNTGSIQAILPGYEIIDSIYIDESGELNPWDDEEGTHHTGAAYWKVVSSAGGSILTETSADDYELYYDSENRELHLKNFIYECDGVNSWGDVFSPVFSDGDITLVLEGENRISNAADSAVGIAGNLTIRGTGSLTVETTCGEREDSETGEKYFPAAMWVGGKEFTVGEGVTLTGIAENNPDCDLDLWGVETFQNDGTIEGRHQFDGSEEPLEPSEPPEPPAEKEITPVEGLSEDFIHGIDVSTYLSIIQSGAKYYDENGNEANLFRILKDSGVNYIRLRVWNDPFPRDENGDFKYVGEDGETEYSQSDIGASTRNPEGYMEYYLKDGTPVYRQTYGAGVCDVDTAIQIGKIATSYGIKVQVDFHYSDFWSDPQRQLVPKAWDGMDVDEKADALAEFTEESLQAFQDAGVDVGMVQIGNEINNGMAGEESDEAICKLLKAGSSAVRKVDPNILIAVHYTDQQDLELMKDKAQMLEDAEVDYDVFGVSYYQFYNHGTLEELTNTLKTISGEYGKKVMVAEFSYGWTFEDGDGYESNTFNTYTTPLNYAVSPNGQASYVRDVIAAVAAVGEAGIGTFYWEGAWIPVGVVDDDSDGDVWESNVKKWQLFGSGWASVYAKEYDTDWGVQHDEVFGCGWENQAFFDFYGKALPSLKIYQQVYGNKTPEQNEGGSTEDEKPSDSSSAVPMDAAQVSNAVSKIAEAAKSAADGKKSVVTIDMTRADGQEATVVSGEVLKEAMGKNIDLLLQFEGYTWTINGKGIQSAEDVNLKVTLNTGNIPASNVSSLAKDDKAIQLHLEYEGDFGFTAVLTIALGKEYQNLFADLYYYNNGKFEPVSSGKINADGNVDLTFTHASDYVIVISEKNLQNPETGDDNQPLRYLWLMVLAAGACTAAAYAFRRSRNAERYGRQH